MPFQDLPGGRGLIEEASCTLFPLWGGWKYPYGKEWGMQSYLHPFSGALTDCIEALMALTHTCILSSSCRKGTDWSTFSYPILSLWSGNLHIEGIGERGSTKLTEIWGNYALPYDIMPSQVPLCFGPVSSDDGTLFNKFMFCLKKHFPLSVLNLIQEINWFGVKSLAFL